MAENSRPLREWIECFEDGNYDDKSCDVQIDAGWYDWFCSDKALRNKTYKLAPKVKRIAQSDKVDVEKTYVFFKNNCPMDGKLYDDFRICDLESGDVIYTITPRCGHTSNKGQAQVWGRENGFDGPLVKGTWKDVLGFFNV